MLGGDEGERVVVIVREDGRREVVRKEEGWG